MGASDFVCTVVASLHRDHGRDCSVIGDHWALRFCWRRGYAKECWNEPFGNPLDNYRNLSSCLPNFCLVRYHHPHGNSVPIDRFLNFQDSIPRIVGVCL